MPGNLLIFFTVFGERSKIQIRRGINHLPLLARSDAQSRLPLKSVELCVSSRCRRHPAGHQDRSIGPLDLRFYRIVSELTEKGVAFKVTDDPSIDTTSRTRKLVMGILALIAEFENDIRHERQMDGIAKARERGVKFGRKRELTDAAIAEIEGTPFRRQDRPRHHAREEPE